jgi:MFS family permease
MPDSTESIIYSEALRMISEQRADRDSLRTRAGTLLTAASLVTSFLGGVALGRYESVHLNAGLTILGWSAIGAFIAVAVLAVVILLPWPWTFILSPTILVEDHLAGPTKTDPDALRRFLAVTLERHQEGNGRMIRRLFFVFGVACTLLIYEAVAWLMILERG